MVDALAQFRAALAARGLIPGQIEADGNLHRCPVEGGKSGRKDGSYLLHLDGLPAGGFDNWRDGLGWQAWRVQLDRELSAGERSELRLRAEAAKLQRIEDANQRYAEAAVRARRLWRQCRPAFNSHLYLQRKGVQAYGVRQLREQLVIPARDASGALWSLQFINPNGDKRFLTGGRKRGNYFSIGAPEHVLCICEGYATAASVFEATGHATAVAFDAGNLEPVARALREKLPAITIVICADNDCETPGNPGVSSAVAAAKAVGGRVAIPSFDGSLL